MLRMTLAALVTMLLLQPFTARSRADHVATATEAGITGRGSPKGTVGEREGVACARPSP